jgi:cell wall-associated NlpC family hydrolase
MKVLLITSVIAIAFGSFKFLFKNKLNNKITKYSIKNLLLNRASFLAYAGGAQIVAAARSQIGVPYSWGGSGAQGKSKGIQQGANTVGFDCSGLSQYAIYHRTKKTIARTAAAQYSDPKCHHVEFGKHEPGDLVFFNDGGSIHHVAIISGPHTQIHAPHTGDHVREAPIMTTGRMALVQRCF